MSTFSNHNYMKKVHSSILRDYMSRDHDSEDVTVDRRLINWSRWLEYRRQITEKLEHRFGRKPPCLVMNSIEDRRYVNEEKLAFEQTKVFITPDKYRGSPYDWLPPLLLPSRGKRGLPDLEVKRLGLERGIINPIEYIDTPTIIRKEKLVDGHPKRLSVRKKWDSSPYVQKKLPNTKNIRNHRPILDDLIIKGDSIQERIDSHQMQISLPVLTVSDWSDYWERCEEVSTASLHVTDESTGDLRGANLKVENSIISSKKETKKVYSRDKYKSISTKENTKSSEDRGFSLEFNAKVNSSCKKYLQLENPGTTKLTYWWRPRKYSDVFSDIRIESVFSHFFFNIGGGILMPGHVLHIPVWFHSRRPGIFVEYWELMVVPMVALGSNDIVFRFWGIAVEEDSSDLEYSKIHSYIKMRVSETQALKISEDLLVRTHYPDEPLVRNKILYLNENIFRQKNPSCFYHPSIVEDLANLYKEVVGDPNAEWNFDINLLRYLIIKDKTDSKKLEERLNFLCNCLKTLHQSWPTPSQSNKKELAVRSIIGTFANNMEKEAEDLKVQFPFKIIKSVSKSPSVLTGSSGDTTRMASIKPRRISQAGSLKHKKKSSGSGSGLGMASKTSSIPSLQKSPGSSKKSQDVISQDSVCIDEKMYTLYKEALFVKVYHHLGTAMEQISSVLDSMKPL
ncbi:hypothetical protein L9F63_019560 [Diploptera punctata]|uniref:MYCBP-associated protein n=1 Tax=Diploptera punctata TaxID=6984 RepID=A0AAD8EE86_DIPPU|nr:hypothetical protein L9F63_019560 [Diploptera punctata]